MLDNLTALAETTLGGSVCILLLLTLGPALSRRFSPKWRYLAWTLVALCLLTFPALRGVVRGELPALVQVPVPQAVENNAYNRYDARDRDYARIVEAGSGSSSGATDMQGQWFRHYAHYENEAGQEVLIQDNDYVRTVTVGDKTTYTIHWTGVAMGIYYAIFVLNVVLVLGRYRRSRKRLLIWSAPTTREEDLAALEAARQRVNCNRDAELYRCPKIHSPLLMGFTHPVILLPRELPVGSLEAALAHELTHLKRKDTGYMLFLTLARCAHWFNPLVWLMVRAARRDMELCCDYDLLQGQNEAVRRAYGRAILDQMNGRDRGLSGLTTGFSGGKKEVFARFRAMMDTAPKRKGRALLVLAAAAIMLSGSLVACQPAADSGPEREPMQGTPEMAALLYAWVEHVDLDNRTVTYIPLTEEQWQDREALLDELGDLERENAPLAADANIYHTYDGERYPLNPTALVYTLGMSQAGLPGQLSQAETGDQAGEIIGVWLDAPSQLDLTAAILDFTGYCGTVYAAGQGGAQLLHGQAALSVDPCDESGQDSDHTWYTLPLAEDFTSAEDIRAFLTGTSSANYPALFRFTVVNGEVTAAVGIWEQTSNEENSTTVPIDPGSGDESSDEEGTLVPIEPETESSEDEAATVPIDPDPEAETPSNPENMPEHNPNFYGENGAEDMPEFDPGFYGESGAQPLEPQ